MSVSVIAVTHIFDSVRLILGFSPFCCMTGRALTAYESQGRRSQAANGMAQCGGESAKVFSTHLRTGMAWLQHRRKSASAVEN